jgi:hypothetical protein
MTLMELVVTMALASALLGSIFYWIGAQNKLSRELAHMREEIYAQEKLELELASSLGKLCLKPKMDEKDKSSGFKLEVGELHFYFKSDACIHPEMNLIQKGLLRLEGEKLVLTSSPCPEFWPSELDMGFQNRKVLAIGIERLEFYFLYLDPVGPLSKKNEKAALGQDKVLTGLLQEAEALREDLPVATVLKLQKGAQTFHFAIWREDGALIHQLEGSASL